MSDRPILSVDTSSDESSAWFAIWRADLYQQLEGQIAIDRLVGGVVDRDELLRVVRAAEARERPYRAIVVSSHGAQGIVFDARGGELISAADPPGYLEEIARDRVIYTCSCRTMDGALGDALGEAGARLVIGFTGEPTWESDGARRMWADLDRELLHCIVDERGAAEVRAVRDRFLGQIAQTFPFADETFQGDLVNMQNVLWTMVVREGNNLR